MKHSFYDVKAKAKVTAETKDGRSLTAFVSKEDWEKAKK